MPINEKELNANLLRERQHLTRVRKVAVREDATVEDILAAIDEEIADIDVILYQEPPMVKEGYYYGIDR